MQQKSHWTGKMTIEEIREKLKDRNLSEVARQTKLHKNAIYRFMDGSVKPYFETVQKLNEYLEGENG
jgi:DNA-binding phage protein